METTKFSQCSCINCGKKLPCFEYTGAVHGAFVCCSKRCWYDFMGYDDDELEELERQGELDDEEEE